MKSQRLAVVLAVSLAALACDKPEVHLRLDPTGKMSPVVKPGTVLHFAVPIKWKFASLNPCVEPGPEYETCTIKAPASGGLNAFAYRCASGTCDPEVAVDEGNFRVASAAPPTAPALAATYPIQMICDAAHKIDLGGDGAITGATVGQTIQWSTLEGNFELYNWKVSVPSGCVDSSSNPVTEFTSPSAVCRIATLPVAYTVTGTYRGNDPTALCSEAPGSVAP